MYAVICFHHTIPWTPYVLVHIRRYHPPLLGGGTWILNEEGIGFKFFRVPSPSGLSTNNTILLVFGGVFVSPANLDRQLAGLL